MVGSYTPVSSDRGSGVSPGGLGRSIVVTVGGEYIWSSARPVQRSGKLRYLDGDAVERLEGLSAPRFEHGRAASCKHGADPLTWIFLVVSYRPRLIETS